MVMTMTMVMRTAQSQEQVPYFLRSYIPTMTSSNGNIFRFTGPLSPVTGEFPSQRPGTRSFDVFFDLSLNKRFNKQSWGLRRHRVHYDVTVMCLFTCLSKIPCPIHAVDEVIQHDRQDIAKCRGIRMQSITEWMALYNSSKHAYMDHGPLTRYVKLRVAHAPGMPGTFFSPLRDARAVMHAGIAN